MTRRLARLSPEAAAWLRAEIAYIADRNPAAAKKIARAARQMLSENPNIGPFGVIPGTRRFVVKPCVLTFRQRGGILEIVAIRHARQMDACAPRDVPGRVSADETSADR